MGLTRRRSLVLLAAAGVLSLGSIQLACAQRSNARAGAGPVEPPTEVRPVVTDFTNVRGEPYELYSFPFRTRDRLVRVVDLGMSVAIGDALGRLRNAVVAINGGFFGVDHSVEGLVVVGGTQIAAFDSRIGGGVLTIARGRAALHAAETFQLPVATDFAIQCRPRLVVDGAVNIRSDDGRHADRTALCIRERGARIDVIIARSRDLDGARGPSLFELANRLHALGCEEALNLDGGPSTAVAWIEQGRRRVLSPRAAIRHALVFTAP